MMQMMDFIRRQLGISYEEIKVSKVPGMIEGAASSAGAIQESSSREQMRDEKETVIDAEAEVVTDAGKEAVTQEADTGSDPEETPAGQESGSPYAEKETGSPEEILP